MKSTNSVRSPKIAASGFGSSRTMDMSLGDILRKAKKDLFFARCVYCMMAIMIVTAVVALFLLGYVDMLVDWFLELL